jgi:hypothetical protein
MSLTIFVENVGSVDFNITDFDFTFQDVTTDLLVGVSEANLTLALVRTTRPLRRSIERCANTMYCAEMLVNGTSKDTGAICDDVEELKFDITAAQHSHPVPARHPVDPNSCVSATWNASPTDFSATHAACLTWDFYVCPRQLPY